MQILSIIFAFHAAFVAESYSIALEEKALFSIKLEQIRDKEAFKITVTNNSYENLLLFKWPWVWEIEIFDDKGRKISDEETWIKESCLTTWWAGDWLLLQKGEGFSFVKAAFDSKGNMKITGRKLKAKLKLHGGRLPEPAEYLKGYSKKIIIKAIPKTELQIGY